MDALREAIRKIHSDPTQTVATTLRALIKSLDGGDQFELNKLYELNYADFALAMGVLKQWRLDSYRYERGWVSRAVVDPSEEVRVPAWRYGVFQPPV